MLVRLSGAEYVLVGEGAAERLTPVVLTFLAGPTFLALAAQGIRVHGLRRYDELWTFGDVIRRELVARGLC
jgi:hypothetical protein